ncbi:MAG: helix-turn-helix domain-containing protein [Thermoplasmata archaeon]
MRSIAQNMDVSPPELSRLVKSLRAKGLVVLDRQGMTSSVSISDQKHASRLRRVLDEFSHMKLETIVSLASLDVLSALAASPGSSRTDLMQASDVSARTLHTTMKRLRELGVVRDRARGVYEISDRFQPLAEFVREFDDYSNQKKAKEFCPDAMMIWQRGREFIIRTKCVVESNEFRLTAFSVFEQYGVPLFLAWQYYYHPVGKWRRTIDEVLLQSMLLKPRDTRENTAILMLWHKHNMPRDLDQLRKGASRYGLREELETISDYFRDPEGNRPPGFPKMDELKRKLRSGTP